MTQPHRSQSDDKRSAVARLTPRSIFSYWRLTWRRLTAVFGPPLLVLIVGIVALQGTLKITEARADGRRSRAVTDAGTQLIALLTDAETGQRGYLLTDNEDYLRPYLRAVDSVPAGYRAASCGSRHRRRDRHDEERRRQPHALCRPRVSELAESLRLRQHRGRAAALALVKSNKGCDYMRDARRFAMARARSGICAPRLTLRRSHALHERSDARRHLRHGRRISHRTDGERAPRARSRGADSPRRRARRGCGRAARVQRGTPNHAASDPSARSPRRCRSSCGRRTRRGRANTSTAAGDEYAGMPGATPAIGEWRDSIHPVDIDAVNEKWNRSFRTGEPFEVESRLRRGSDGSYRWFLCRALPLRDETGADHTLVRHLHRCARPAPRERRVERSRRSERRARGHRRH